MQADGSGCRRRVCDTVLQDPVDGQFDPVFVADNVVTVPLARRAFVAVMLLGDAHVIGLAERGMATAVDGDRGVLLNQVDVPGVLVLQLGLDGLRPQFVLAGRIQEDAAVGRVIRPSPFYVQLLM